jgi:dTDP-4-dehydrorhamnose reductase
VIWLIGCKGMLGTELSALCTALKLPFTGTGRTVDITDPAALADFVAKQTVPIKWIVNCAAYTAVDKAEDDDAACRALNSAGAAHIAAIARSLGAPLIHLSTDYVFDGKGIRPYTEDENTEPIGVYGRTKRDGERGVRGVHERNYIIRTAWLSGQYGKTPADSMLRLMAERESVSVVNDQHGSPTWTRDLARTIVDIIRRGESGKSIPYGIYHYTNEGECTWFEFACAIHKKARKLGLLHKNCRILPCSSTEFPAKVTRPAYSVLDKSKIKLQLGEYIPAWEDSLDLFLNMRAEIARNKIVSGGHPI